MRSSTRLMTFEEILASPVDVDEYYLRFKDQYIKSFLDLKSLSLILAGQPIGVLVDHTAEFEEATQYTMVEVDPTIAEEQVGTTTTVIHTEANQGAVVEVDQKD